jgi:hypothetical protein
MAAKDVRSTYASTQTVSWGFHDGSGEPIELTFREYLDTFVTDHPFAEAPEIAWNTPADRGTTIDNALDVYPDGQVVEYHFPGFDPQYEGMDWASLKLAFEEHEEQWYLVGVIHSEWSP